MRHIHPLSSRVSTQAEVLDHALMPFSQFPPVSPPSTATTLLPSTPLRLTPLTSSLPRFVFYCLFPSLPKAIRKSETDVPLFVSCRASSPVLPTLTESSAQTLLNLRRLRLGSRLTFTRVSRPRFPSKRSYVREDAVGGMRSKK